MGSKRECRETRYRKSKIFHSIAEIILHVTKQTRTDIELEVEYFTTQVPNNNVDD